MNNEAKKIDFVFFGTPEVASTTLEILKLHGYTPTLVVTTPDRPVGRKFVMTPPPVKTWALENNIPFIQPEKLTDEVISSLPKTSLFIVVAYGKILPQILIDTPSIATLNIHYSLLPRWRGASPVEAALLHNDSETGVSIQKMVFKLDAGPVIDSKKILIVPNDTAETLTEKLIPLGAELLIGVLNKNNFEGVEQDESLVTHCKKITKEEGLVNPDTDNPQELWNKYRAYFGWPGIYFFDPETKRVKIIKARFEAGKFIIEKVVPEGKKEMAWEAYTSRT